MLVDGARGGGGELALLLALLLYLRDLLPLSRRRRDLHAEDYVADLGLSERCYVHAVGRILDVLVDYVSKIVVFRFT